MADTPHEITRKWPIATHHEIKETFADHVGSVLFDGQTLRIDFAVARMNEPMPPAPPTGERHITCRLVLSPSCTLDLINQLQKIAVQLTQAGLVVQGQPKPQRKPN